MVRAELAAQVASNQGISKKTASLVVNAVFGTISDALAKGDKVELRGFGSFTVRRHDARIGRNPRTGETVSVPAKKVPFFKPGKDLKIID